MRHSAAAQKQRGLLSLQKALRASRQPAQCAASVRFESVDFSRPFIPEHFTQLYYTPIYGRLTDPQRLRYNQLFGIKVNEQFMTFESDFTNQILVRLLKHRAVNRNAELIGCMQAMIREERAHQDMFRALNRPCLPEAYHRGDRYFTRLRWHERLALGAVTLFPRHLVFLLWFLIAMEEYSVALSRAMVLHRQTESLGELEENFVRAHREHVKDEARHVHIDVHLIRACLGSLSHRGRSMNARIFCRFMAEIIAPKRGGIAVLEHFLKEDSELEARRGELMRSVQALGRDARFLHTLFNRAMMPKTFALFDEVPELARLRDTLPGYRVHNA